MAASFNEASQARGRSYYARAGPASAQDHFEAFPWRIEIYQDTTPIHWRQRRCKIDCGCRFPDTTLWFAMAIRIMAAAPVLRAARILRFSDMCERIPASLLLCCS